MNTSKSLESIITDKNTPIGQLENGDYLGLSPDESNGIFCIYGNTAQGKSVTLIILTLSAIHNGKGGMFIDPYGDLISEIRSHTAETEKERLIIFEATEKTIDENISKFQKEFDISELNKDSGKMLLCKLDYRTLGVDVARNMGIYLVKEFFEKVEPKNRILGLDEAHNFIDDETLEFILNSKEEDMTCIITDQSPLHYRTDILESLHKKADHLICYYMRPPKIIHDLHPELSIEALESLEKYHFWTKLNIQTEKPLIEKAKGIFPIPFPIND